MYPGQIPMPTMPGGSNPAGRPARVGTPLALTPANTPTGFQMPDITPEAVQMAQQKFLKSGQLPPGLRPGNADVLEKRRGQAIQQGWQDRYSNPAHRTVR